MNLNIPKATYIGASTTYLETVDSTNTYAQKLVTKSTPHEGTAITAGFQTQGRGQIGRSWAGDADKNIYTSIILKPDFIVPANQFSINMAISTAVNSCCSELMGTPAKIKWPNDIYAGNKKLCGILIQNTMSGTKINYSIVGVGMNVNQESFSKELPNPTSLYLVKGMHFNLNYVRETLYDHIEYWYEKLRNSQMDIIRSKYHNNLFRLNIETNFYAKGEYFSGEIIGVEDQGRLIVKTKGVLKTFNLHEIKMIVDSIQV